MEVNQSIQNPLAAGTQVGQGEAFVYNTPNVNPFSALQGALNNQLNLKQRELDKKEDEKKKNDANLQKALIDLQVDPKWDKAVGEFNTDVNDLSDFVASWGAKGLPYDSSFQMAWRKKQLSVEAKKSMNEKTFDEYSKLKLKWAADPDKYDQAAINEWEKGLSSQKDIKGRYDYVMNNPQPGEYFDTLKYFRDNFSKDIQQGRYTYTDPKKQRAAVVTSFENLPEYRQNVIYKQGLQDGSWKSKEEMFDSINSSLKPYYINERTPSPVGGGGSGSLSGKYSTIVGSSYGTSNGADTIAIAFGGGEAKPIQLSGENNQAVEMVPSQFIYTGNPGESTAKGGWYVRGKEYRSEKTFESKQDADSFASQGTDFMVEQDPTTQKWVVKKVIDVDVPLTEKNRLSMSATFGRQFDPSAEANAWNKQNGLGTINYYRLPRQGVAPDSPEAFQEQ